MQTMQGTTSLPVPVRPLGVARLGRHRRLVVGAAALGLITAAAAWQWSWLVAAGIAPLLLSAAPCAVMCGLGLCMGRMGSRSCGSASSVQQGGQADRGACEIPTDFTGRMET